MIRKIVDFAIAIMATVMLSACGGDGSDGNASDSSAPNEAAPYVGDWVTACTQLVNPGDVVETYVIYAISIDATELEFTLAAYLDDACTSQMQVSENVESVRGTITITASYLDGGTVMTSDGLTANSLDTTLIDSVNTLDEPDAEPDSAMGTAGNVLVYINDTNTLYLDEETMALSDDSSKLALTRPFNPN